MTMDPIDAYRSARQRVSGFAADLDSDALEQMVLACPGWRVRDVVAHVVGVASDLTSGVWPEDESWTANQVEARRDRPIVDILAEWETSGPRLEAALAGDFGVPPGILVSDLVNHEIDMRSTVDDADLVWPELAVALAMMVDVQAGRISAAGLPPLRLIADGAELGDPGAETTVRASSFDLLRAATGRRTVHEVRAFDWAGDPEPYVGVFARFEPPAEPLPA